MSKISKVVLCLFVLGACTFLACLLILKRTGSGKITTSQNDHNKPGRSPIVDLPTVDRKTAQRECQFGFDFLEDLLEQHTTTSHLLPAHRKQNFSGALVSQDIMCLDTMDAIENQWVGIYECHGQGRNQAVTFTTDGNILGGSSKILCLAMKNMVSKSVVLKKCNANDDTQKWTTNSKYGLIMPKVRQDHCLNSPAQENKEIMIESCGLSLLTQRWQLVMQEVLALWLDDTQGDVKISQLKKRGTRKQMDKLMLQNKPTTDKLKYVDSLFFR